MNKLQIEWAWTDMDIFNGLNCIISKINISKYNI